LLKISNKGMERSKRVFFRVEKVLFKIIL